MSSHHLPSFAGNAREANDCLSLCQNFSFLQRHLSHCIWFHRNDVILTWLSTKTLFSRERTITGIVIQSLSCVRLFVTPMDCRVSGFPVLHHLPEFAQTHVCRVGDTIQPSHPLLSASPSTLNFSQHRGLFKWIGSSHQVVKVLEYQLQHQSFQWIFKTDFL